MSKNLRSQLQEIRPEVRASTRKPPLVVATLNEGTAWVEDSWVLFEPTAKDRLYVSSPAHLFSILRDAVRLATGDDTWSVRYASQIKRENVPFLHCSSSNHILFDPFALFRDPIRELYTKRYFLWPIAASQSYFFKPYDEVRELDAKLKTIEDLRKALDESGSVSGPPLVAEAPEGEDERGG
jgi:hypothetical protein